MSLWNWVSGRIHLRSTSWSPNILFISNEPYCSKDNIVRSFVENLFTTWQPRSLVLRWFDARLVVIPFFFFLAIYYPWLMPSPAFPVTFAYSASFEVFTIPVVISSEGNVLTDFRPYWNFDEYSSLIKLTKITHGTWLQNQNWWVTGTLHHPYRPEWSLLQRRLW